jgi:hypothetical protein
MHIFSRANLLYAATFTPIGSPKALFLDLHVPLSIPLSQVLIIFCHEDGGSRLFRKVCNDLQEYLDVTSLEVVIFIVTHKYKSLINRTLI